jgi:hypothetical protein
MEYEYKWLSDLPPSALTYFPTATYEEIFK